jgi:hypothetical protein
MQSCSDRTSFTAPLPRLGPMQLPHTKRELANREFAHATPNRCFTWCVGGVHIGERRSVAVASGREWYAVPENLVARSKSKGSLCSEAAPFEGHFVSTCLPSATRDLSKLINLATYTR